MTMYEHHAEPCRLRLFRETKVQTTVPGQPVDPLPDVGVGYRLPALDDKGYWIILWPGSDEERCNLLVGLIGKVVSNLAPGGPVDSKVDATGGHRSVGAMP
jgi:hypothetical protein